MLALAALYGAVHATPQPMLAATGKWLTCPIGTDKALPRSLCFCRARRVVLVVVPLVAFCVCDAGDRAAQKPRPVWMMRSIPSLQAPVDGHGAVRADRQIAEPERL